MRTFYNQIISQDIISNTFFYRLSHVQIFNGNHTYTH